METASALLSVFTALQAEHISGLIVLSALGLAAFALFVVYSVTRGRK